jgi:hypothetical protein
MVSADLRSWLEAGALFASQASKPVLERLDPPRRAAVVMALLALVLTGLFLVACIMLGGHWVRRLARHKPGSRAANSSHSAGNRGLRDSLHAILPEAKSDDTVQLESPSNDTKVDS